MCCMLLSLCCMQCLQTWPDNSELSVQPWEETTQRRVNTRNKAESFYAHNYFQHTVKLILSVQAVQAVQAVLTWEKQNFKFSINIFNQRIPKMLQLKWHSIKARRTHLPEGRKPANYLMYVWSAGLTSRGSQLTSAGQTSRGSQLTSAGQSAGLTSRGSHLTSAGQIWSCKTWLALI